LRDLSMNKADRRKTCDPRHFIVPEPICHRDSTEPVHAPLPAHTG